MAKVCIICGKRPRVGGTLTRRGLAKKEGGVGIRIVRANTRRFLPNLQRVKAVIAGVTRHVRVCTVCLKSGRLTKAPRRLRPDVGAPSGRLTPA